jgi:hypothetical protein
VDPGKPPNAVQRIICDPGSRDFEATKPGLFYTMIGRGTTIGGVAFDGLRYDSSVYFYDFGYGKGPLSPERIVDLRRSLTTGKVYERIRARDRWMQHLKEHTHDSNMSDKEIEQIFQWARTTKVTTNQLDAILSSTVWRSHDL